MILFLQRPIREYDRILIYHYDTLSSTTHQRIRSYTSMVFILKYSEIQLFLREYDRIHCIPSEIYQFNSSSENTIVYFWSLYDNPKNLIRETKLNLSSKSKKLLFMEYTIVYYLNHENTKITINKCWDNQPNMETFKAEIYQDMKIDKQKTLNRCCHVLSFHLFSLRGHSLNAMWILEPTMCPSSYVLQEIAPDQSPEFHSSPVPSSSVSRTHLSH
jgi:hypothetical protein